MYAIGITNNDFIMGPITKKYDVVEPVTIGDAEHDAGETIELEETTAAEHVESGALKLAEEQE